MLHLIQMRENISVMVSIMITRNTRLVSDAFHVNPGRFDSLLRTASAEMLSLPAIGARIHTSEDYFTAFSDEIMRGRLSDWILYPFVELSWDILRPVEYVLDPTAVVVENEHPERVDAFIEAYVAAALTHLLDLGETESDIGYEVTDDVTG